MGSYVDFHDHLCVDLRPESEHILTILINIYIQKAIIALRFSQGCYSMKEHISFKVISVWVSSAFC
jgi:hypothetical protein